MLTICSINEEGLNRFFSPLESQIIAIVWEHVKDFLKSATDSQPIPIPHNVAIMATHPASLPFTRRRSLETIKIVVGKIVMIKSAVN